VPWGNLLSLDLLKEAASSRGFVFLLSQLATLSGFGKERPDVSGNSSDPTSHDWPWGAHAVKITQTKEQNGDSMAIGHRHDGGRTFPQVERAFAGSA
jgi:hypothetical protein